MHNRSLKVAVQGLVIYSFIQSIFCKGRTCLLSSTDPYEKKSLDVRSGDLIGHAIKSPNTIRRLGRRSFRHDLSSLCNFTFGKSDVIYLHASVSLSSSVTGRGKQFLSLWFWKEERPINRTFLHSCRDHGTAPLMYKSLMEIPSLPPSNPQIFPIHLSRRIKCHLFPADQTVHKGLAVAQAVG
jgi:hypothetical protein